MRTQPSLVQPSLVQRTLAGRPPFRADHIGSLLRPVELRRAFRRHGAREIDDAEFAAVQDACIRDAVRMQEEIGLSVVTDGEFRRASYWARFVERVEGFGLRTSMLPFKDDQGHQIEFVSPYARGKLRRTGPLAVDEFRFLQNVAKVAPKITLPSPSTMHFYGTTDYGAPAGYADIEDFFADLARVYAEEIAELGKAGCEYVQIDEVAVALLVDPQIRRSVEMAGGNPDRLVTLYIDAINLALAGRPPGMTVGVHVCRGNYKGHYLGQGGYGSVADRFFGRTDAQVFLLEFDTARAGDFAPLKQVPQGKSVVLGLVSTKTPVLEPIDQLLRRVEEATKYIALDRLAISPQCGFASAAAGNPISENDQRNKLRRVVEAAERIWS
jgi:5-methyltetrahydropteroyltriglutamate--homocysteine methyltransferase